MTKVNVFETNGRSTTFGELAPNDYFLDTQKDILIKIDRVEVENLQKGNAICIYSTLSGDIGKLFHFDESDAITTIDSIDIKYTVRTR